MDNVELSTVPPFLDGVYLGINAVPDAYLLIDCPSGCFFKCERIAVNHDLTSTLFDPLGRHRIVQSGINFTDLALGSEKVLAKIARRVHESARPRALFLTQSSPVTVTSNDLVTFAKDLTERLSVPVVYIQPHTMEGDYLDGFAAFTEAVVEMAEMRAKTPTTAGPKDVTLVGYFADRLEEDHKANISELHRIISLLGGTLSGVLCGGESLADLDAALAAPVLIELPYGGAAARKIAARTGAKVVPAPLPLGIGNTERFTTAVGTALGLTKEKIREVIGNELSGFMDLLDTVRSRFLSDRSVAVAADPAMAAGLVGFLAELGTDIPLVSVRTRSEHRLEQVRKAVADAGLSTNVVFDRSVPAFRRELQPLPDLLVGSSLERETAHDLGLGFVELGYPAFLTHALYPRPFLGFAGIKRLADDLVNAIQQADLQRNC